MAGDEGDAMSKSGVIVLEQMMVKSRAWLSLSGTAVQVYLLFRCKCQVAKRCRPPGKRSEGLLGRILNNGELVFTYHEAKRLYGITAGRFRRAIDELIEKGFLDIAETGMGLYKMATHYAISDRWRWWGTERFETAKRPEPSIRGCGFRKGNKLWQKAHRKKSSAIRAHGDMLKIAHGEVLAMRTDAHGQKIVNRYNYCDGRYLCTQIA
jgi:hypothetical protein